MSFWAELIPLRRELDNCSIQIQVEEIKSTVSREEIFDFYSTKNNF